MPLPPDGTHGTHGAHGTHGSLRSTAPLAGGADGPRSLRPLLDIVLEALEAGAAARGGPIPAGGPRDVGHRVRSAAEPLIPEAGAGSETALRELVRVFAESAADPADPLCAAHLHCPPLAVAAAADLAASALNPSMDSWDQAPGASTLEDLVARGLATEIFPAGHAPDALVTTGGTESNQMALLLARERAAAGAAGAAGSADGDHGPVRVVCGANAHHSIIRGAWLLGLPEPLVLPTPAGILSPTELDRALGELRGPVLAVATAGTSDAGEIDPLPQLADVCTAHSARFHVDAAYGFPLLFSTTLRPQLDGLARADSVTADLHKLGWQPVAAGLLAVPDRAALAPLGHRADYLNPADDTEAGIPDLLGRSLRTTRRPDVLKIAVTLRALGRTGIAVLVEHACAAAQRLADLVEDHPGFDLYERPTLSTVLFRPAGADDERVASVRRHLMTEGRAVLGRARATDHRDGVDKLWFKATVLNPHTRPTDLEILLGVVEGSTAA
ncbi:pyridoxal phosphate-dependent decarboxylase family protein [Streptomyces sp. NPDC048639]|uniref:pyridoxal phosphate-dependent decarboxylase family protein n=1 Tax=Streptomyces sp. NPDC048639 TaxID=3365581 RepID=UPI0037139C77